MADSLQFKLDGVEDLKRELRAAPEKIRRLAVRGALRKAGRVISTAAKAAAPVLAVPTKTRRPGTVKRAIRVATSKFARRTGDEGVYIGVRPLRGRRQVKLGKAGATNPNDPYYWWFVELGTAAHKIRARKGKRLGLAPSYPRVVSHPGTKGAGFMASAAREKGQEAVGVFMREAIPQIEKLNAKALTRGR